jgi:hypothetical protein
MERGLVKARGGSCEIAILSERRRKKMGEERRGYHLPPAKQIPVAKSPAWCFS